MGSLARITTILPDDEQEQEQHLDITAVFGQLHHGF